MKAETVKLGNKEITHIISDDVLIQTVQDAIDIIGNTQTDYLILHSHNFEPDFFDLSTRKLGEVLQKFTNYRLKLAIIGDFEVYPGHVLKEFIGESNRHGEYLFLHSVDEVKERWH